MSRKSEVEIDALEQNASAVVAEAVAGTTVIITDRGRPVARMSPIPTSRLRSLIEDGLARPPRRALNELPAPAPGPDVSGVLTRTRDDQRY